MRFRQALAALLVAACVPLFATAQTYDPNGNTKIAEPALPLAAFTLSTACATPTTPKSCASTSYAIIPTSGGAALVSLQISASMAGDTITTLSGNDGTNFLALNTTQPNNTGASAASTITAAGRYAANVADAQYVAVVLTAGSTAVTVTPYVSQKSLSGASSGGGSYTAPPVQPVSGTVSAIVNTAPPYVAPTCSAAPNAPCVQVTGPVAVTGAFPTPLAVQPISGAPTPYPTNADGGAPVHIVNTPAPAPSVVAISSLPPVSLTGTLPQPAATLPVTTPAPQTSAAPGYTRVEDATTTNLLTVDSNGRLTTTPTGCGADTAFPTSISTSGTSLGTLPACAKGVEMDVPPGATVVYYVAQSALGTAGAALAVSHQYANPSSSQQPLPVQVNLANSQLVFITYVVSGTAGTYISGLPTFRWI